MDNTHMDIEEMIDAYGDELLRLCTLYLGDRQLAEDAFQTAVIKAWRHLNTFRGESSLKTWLFRIGVNVCRDTLRSGWFRLRRRCEPLDALALSQSAPQSEAAGEVTQAVLALPGKYREVIVLYYYEDMKIREIAATLHLPANSVSTRLRRARALLGEALKGEIEA